MLSASDFKVGELVRMKSADQQRTRGCLYERLYGHLCVVEEVEASPDTKRDEYDCITLRSIATNERFEYYVHRVEKYDGGG